MQQIERPGESNPKASQSGPARLPDSEILRLTAARGKSATIFVAPPHVEVIEQKRSTPVAEIVKHPRNRYLRVAVGAINMALEIALRSPGSAQEFSADTIVAKLRDETRLAYERADRPGNEQNRQALSNQLAILEEFGTPLTAEEQATLADNNMLTDREVEIQQAKSRLDDAAAIEEVFVIQSVED